MRVVLDSCILCKDYQLSGSTFRLLFEGITRTGDKIFIPQVVIEEVKNNFIDDIKTIKLKQDKLLVDFRRITNICALPLLSDSYIETLVAQYEAKLRQRLLNENVRVIKYPTITHEKIIQRALKKSKPFKDNGAGYRDYIIWESILNLFEDNIEPIVFITNNSSDFIEKNNQLHSDLVDDLKKIGLSSEIVTIFRSLDEYIEKYVKPQIPFFNILENLNKGFYKEFNLKEKVSHELAEKVFSMDFEFEQIGVPDNLINGKSILKPSIYSISEVSNLKTIDTRELSTNEILLEVIGSVNCEFEYGVVKTALSSNEGNEILCKVKDKISNEATFIIRIIFNPATGNVISSDLMSIVFNSIEKL